MSKSLSGPKGHLVPTSRVDKNGRVVVRHMKTGHDGLGEPKKTIPAPRSTSATKDALLNGAVALIETTVGDVSYSYALGRGPLIEGLSKFSDSTLARIAGATDAHCRQVIFCVYDELRKQVTDEGYVNDLLMLSGYLKEKGVGVDPIGNHLIGARTCDGLEALGADGSYPEKRRSQLAALISATSKATDMVMGDEADISVLDFNSGYTSAVIADDDLRKLIIESTDTDRLRIIEIIDERNTLDVASIRSLLLESTVSTALSSGAL